EPELARPAPPRVEAHLPADHRRLAPEPEALRRTHVRAVDGARIGDMQGAEPVGGRAVAEVEVLAVQEVALVESAELPEGVAPDGHERAVHPVDYARRPAPALDEPSRRRVEEEVRDRMEARRPRLPPPVGTDEVAAGD